MDLMPTLSATLFVLSTLLTVYLFYKASGNSKAVLFVLFVWMIVQSFVSLSGFYTLTSTLPPRMLLAIVPVFVFIIFLFAYRKTRSFILSFDPKTLTLLHVVRIPVELVLLLLFLQNKVPKIMTFEGMNLDIFSGISALAIYYFAYTRSRISKNFLLAWNFICLGLLLNIVTIAILSAPFPFQQLAFDQPNIAVLYFPYILLPSCVVPLVLLSHLILISQLFSKK